MPKAIERDHARLEHQVIVDDRAKWGFRLWFCEANVASGIGGREFFIGKLHHDVRNTTGGMRQAHLRNSGGVGREISLPGPIAGLPPADPGIAEQVKDHCQHGGEDDGFPGCKGRFHALGYPHECIKALSSRGEIAFGIPAKIFVAFYLSFVTFAHSKKREPVISAFSLRLKTDFQLVSTKKSAGKKKPAKAPVDSAKPKHAATAASILGRPVVAKPGMTRSKNSAGPVPIKPEWQKYYETLIDLRERLVLQMNGLAKESAEELAGYSLHMADSGTDNFDRDFALSLLSSDQDAVYEIEEALKRIEKHTYGICELTGKAIPRARLEAIPWTRFTVEAQAQLEKEGALRQRRLGALGSVDSVGVTEVQADDDEPDEKPAKEKE